MDFKIGDRIIGLAEYDGINLTDLKGTVLSTDLFDAQCYLVEFDIPISGHSGRGIGKDGHCWWVTKECITLLAPTESEHNINKVLLRSQKLWNKSNYVVKKQQQLTPT